MRMKRCKECGKKLKVVEGYRHPVLGKDTLLCSNCFDSVHESVIKWREANLPYVGFFKQGNSLNKYETNLKKIFTDWNGSRNTYY